MLFPDQRIRRDGEEGLPVVRAQRTEGDKVTPVGAAQSFNVMPIELK